MGLDVYVGSFTRYYAGDWETVVQKYGREQGIDVEVLRAEAPTDAMTDQAEIRRTVLSWRDRLSQALGSNIDRPLDWNESDDAPYFTDKPAWDCYGALLLWASYAEHPELPCPHDYVEDWKTDRAFQQSSDPEMNTSFSQLLRGVEVWLPHDFSFTFRAAEASGHEVTFGSSVRLCAQLQELNQKTWNATDATRLQWQRDGAEHKAPLEVGARFAFSVLSELAQQAVSNRLIMKLDY